MTLRARGLSVRVGAVTLLAEVSLEVEPGEVVALLGPNGSGKSTLLRTLCGELPAAEGTVTLCDRRLEAWSPRERAARLGVLPQSSRLNFPFTSLQVVLLGRTPHVNGRETARDHDIARQALQRTDTAHLAGRSYLSLSGGERQRVQLARVLAQVWDAPPDDVRHVLLDEPTSSLDLKHQHALLELANELAGHGFGVLVSLHDLNLAAQYASRAVLLRGGRLVAEGSPRDVLSTERIRQVWGIDASAGLDARTGRWTVSCGPPRRPYAARALSLTP